MRRAFCAFVVGGMLIVCPLFTGQAPLPTPLPTAQATGLPSPLPTAPERVRVPPTPSIYTVPGTVVPATPATVVPATTLTP